MAKKSLRKEIHNDIKNETKRAAKKGVKNAVKSKKNKRSVLLMIMPYALVVFALVFAVLLVTQRIVGEDPGIVGELIIKLFGGLFGGAAILFPAFLGFYGVKWCIYNIKWRERSMKEDAPDHEDYKKAKRRLVTQGIMAFLSILMISSIFGIFAGADNMDFIDMWESGAEDLLEGGGGILGSGIAALLILSVREVAATIIVVFLLLVFGLFTVGLTPDYIVEKIQCGIEKSKLARKEREAEREKEEQERAEAERLEEERLAKEQRAAKVTGDPTLTVKVENEPKAPPQNTIEGDELFGFGEAAPAEEKEKKKKSKGTKSGNPFDDDTDNSLGGDYGGEPGFDTEEFGALDNFFSSIEDQRPIENIFEDGDKPENIEPEGDIELHKMDAEDISADMAAVTPDEGAEEEEEEEPPTPYVFPPIDLLAKSKGEVDTNSTEEIQANARLLVSTLKSFKIEIKEINCSRGPTITRYELRPEAGVRVRSIANLVDDISLSLATSGVRIEAPIPGKAAVGIEVPNKNRATVYLRDLIDNQKFADAKSKLTASLGKDVGGNPVYFDISKMPHMLIAGATGMGKSVCINCVIISLLYKARPEDLKLILIDPKKVEFNIYKDIPHLYCPIVSDPKKAAGALASAVAEMERRFELIEEVGVRDIASYNAATENDPYKEHMPHMVIIIDELADLMMTAPDEVETAICRLAQKARAAGIHIIIGTQRPSVDVITGLIKANIPSRIACTVASQVDSRTIIDIAGAEKLIGRGDMLFAPVGAAKPMRVQGAFVSDGEVESIVTFIRENNAKAKYNAEFINRIEEEAAKCGVKKGGAGGSDSLPSGADDGGDSKFAAAVKLAVEEGKISTSLMQRRLGVGYGRAAKIIDTMEQLGYVSKPDGNKPRRVLLSAEEYANRINDGTLGGEDA